MFVRNVLSHDMPAVESFAAEMAKTMAAVNRARVVCPEVDSDKFRITTRKNGQLVATAVATSVEGTFPAIRKAIPSLYNKAAMDVAVTASFRLAREHNHAPYGKGGFTITATYESKEAHRNHEAPVSVTVSSFGFEEKQALLVSEFVANLQEIVDLALDGLTVDAAFEALAVLRDFADEIAEPDSAETAPAKAPAKAPANAPAKKTLLKEVY